MRNDAVLDRWIPIVNDWSKGLNNLITCAKIRELQSSVTHIEENMTEGAYREKKRKCTDL